MPSIAKKILSAFVEVNDERPSQKTTITDTKQRSQMVAAPPADTRFIRHFDKLFEEANFPGPDYYEFSKMVEALQSVPDEKARYTAAFVGLAVQGLDKEKLLLTASQYLQLLDQDSTQFLAEIANASRDKVEAKKKEMEEKTQRVQELTSTISALQKEVATLSDELRDSEQKIAASANGYKAAMEQARMKLLNETEKIKSLI